MRSVLRITASNLPDLTPSLGANVESKLRNSNFVLNHGNYESNRFIKRPSVELGNDFATYISNPTSVTASASQQWCSPGVSVLRNSRVLASAKDLFRHSLGTLSNHFDIPRNYLLAKVQEMTYSYRHPLRQHMYWSAYYGSDNLPQRWDCSPLRQIPEWKLHKTTPYRRAKSLD